MKKFLSGLLICVPLLLQAQSYNDSLLLYRQQYKDEFLKDEHSPLRKEDTSFLRFFAPDKHYRLVTTFTPAKDPKPFDMATHSGKIKKYILYGTASFKLNDTVCKLEIYQGVELIKKPELKDYLFIPFNDYTNSETSYGGGRYLDFRIGDIKDGKLVIDFNKCYNPYCAYADGYSCPIPPDANRLQVAIPAGEANFGRSHE